MRMERPPGRGKAQAAALTMVQLLPNLITLGAGCAGLTAIRLAFDGHVATSVSLIMLAALLDLLDGFTARLLQSTSAIGAELDSLVDIVNFGVAPGLVLYIWALDGWRSSGWIAVLIFAICAALRLARYNTEAKAGRAPGGGFFRGVPAPGAALLVLLPLVVAQNWPGLLGPALQPLTAIWLVAVGLMMIARFQTPSLRRLRIARESAPFMMVGLIAVVAAAITWPWPVLLAFQLVYLAVLARYALKPPSSGGGEEISQGV